MTVADTPFAERLRAVMGARRLTLRDMAKECDVSPQAVKKWRDGVAMPSSHHFICICRICGCSHEWLFAPNPMDWESSDTAPQGRHAKYWVREAIEELREIGIIGGDK